MNPVFLDLARSDFRDSQVSEERRQVDATSPVLAVDVLLIALPLRDDVVLVQVMFRDIAKGSQLTAPVVGEGVTVTES